MRPRTMKERIEDWLFFILRKLPHKYVAGDCPNEKGPLMARFFLLGGMRSRCKLVLHCFFRSDINRAVHDHPWNFITFPFHSYLEHRPDGNVYLVKAWRFHYRPAEWLHWVEVTRKRTWTIAFLSRKRREWGFMTRDGWIHWKEFDSQEGCPE